MCTILKVGAQTLLARLSHASDRTFSIQQFEILTSPFHLSPSQLSQQSTKPITASIHDLGLPRELNCVTIGGGFSIS